VNPNKESSKLRYAAEEGWLDLVDGLDLSAFVLRLGGIYGPGRRLSYASTSMHFNLF
jgi:nucleoside-diphosphate-sugar epimerase